MKRENCRGWKPRQDDDWFPVRCSETDRFSWLQCNTMNNDPRISEFRYHSITKVTFALTRSARHHDDVRRGKAFPKQVAQLRLIINCDSQFERFSSDFTYRIRNYPSIRVVNQRRLHWLRRTNHFVSGRDDSDFGTTPDRDFRLPNCSKHPRLATCQFGPLRQDQLTHGDITPCG